MTFLIAAAGTGGHVFPGLSVGEALIANGVDISEILFVGGDRLEATVYPERGFSFLQLEIRGLRRSLTPSNIALPRLMTRARDRVVEVMSERGTRAALGMGGYVAVPVGMAARRLRIPFFGSEQNAEAGLANRVACRWARRTFGSFPVTEGLPRAEWVGNPVRPAFWDFDRAALKDRALSRYGLVPGVPVLGVVGGSLGAGVLNGATARLAADWTGPEIQILHLTGDRFIEEMEGNPCALGVTWFPLGFEDEMEFFYAASDLVLTRAGGAVAELTATATPSILVPGSFGSAGHQAGNARFLTDAGAAVTLGEEELGGLSEVVAATLLDPSRLDVMADACRLIARPRAAHLIAEAMIEAAA